MVRLRDVADIGRERTSNLIARENAQRKAVISCNVADGLQPRPAGRRGVSSASTPIVTARRLHGRTRRPVRSATVRQPHDPVMGSASRS
jgi:hypothetical protein